MIKPENALQNSIPYKLVKNDPTLCEWLFTGDNNFNKPFFVESISECKQLKENSTRFKCIAQTKMLPIWSSALETVPDPSAIIFHISRCGSTLVSQLLDIKKEHMVLSEVPFFDELLRLPFKDKLIGPDETASYFKAAVQLYTSSPNEIPSHVFIKTDSWHLAFYTQLRKMYPYTPFILLYRHPWEVILSQQRRRGMQSVPGVLEPTLFGFTETQAAEYDLDKYMANVLFSYFTKMIEITTADPLTLTVDYAEGPIPILKKIYAAAGINFDTATQKEMEQRTGFHGKYPEQLFKEENIHCDMPAFMQPVTDLYYTLDKLNKSADPE